MDRTKNTHLGTVRNHIHAYTHRKPLIQHFIYTMFLYLILYIYIYVYNFAF